MFLVTLMTKLAFNQHHLLDMSQSNNTFRGSRLARESKGAEILRNVHTTLEEFENGAFLWLDLPSTLRKVKLTFLGCKIVVLKSISMVTIILVSTQRTAKMAVALRIFENQINRNWLIRNDPANSHSAFVVIVFKHNRYT